MQLLWKWFSEYRIGKRQDGTKEKVQKRLLLANIAEIYACFKSKHPDVKVGFSTVAMLRPKWCVPIGSAGSHNVCLHLSPVCEAHGVSN